MQSEVDNFQRRHVLFVSSSTLACKIVTQAFVEETHLFNAIRYSLSYFLIKISPQF